MQYDAQVTVRVPREIYDSITAESASTGVRRSIVVRNILINHYGKAVE